MGLSAGLGLAEARARFPRLETLKADPAADRRLLEAVADWCDRYTPLVALDPPHGLILDISGCAHLFGGERALTDDLLARLFRQGFVAAAAIAAHAGTALALVRHAPEACVAAGEEIAAVEPLPVAALRLDDELAATLGRLGLKTIGALLELPRAGLARRFGAALIARLDETTGRASRPISPLRPVPALIAERRLFEPVSLAEDVERILLNLVGRLEEGLEERGEGGRRFELSLFRVDGKVERLSVGAAAPVREPCRIQALFRERMKGLGEAFDAGFGYDLVKLAVLASERMEATQEDLSGERGREEDFEGLIGRIGARLGEAAVLRPEPAESHWPERAAVMRPAGEASNKGLGRRSGPARDATAPSAAIPDLQAPRPLRLLADPEPVEASFEVPDGVPLHFRWRRALHIVRRFEGPERIAPEWWRDEDGRSRDYYRIEDEAGRRYWLFREGTHGLARPSIPGDPQAEEAARGGPKGLPAWYLHGIFA